MPETGIGPWTLGKDLATFTIAPVTVSGTTWTPGTAIDCTGLVRRLNHQLRIAAKDIRPITQIQENNVPISTGNAIQIQNLRVSNNTTPGNPLSNVVFIGLYIQVLFNDAHEKFDGYYLVGGYEGGFDGMEEQIQSIDCQPVALTSRAQVLRTFV